MSTFCCNFIIWNGSETQGKDISSLEDIQKLKVKDLREILRTHTESTDGAKADLVLKVFALLMRCVLPSSNNGKNDEAHSSQEQNNDGLQY